MNNNQKRLQNELKLCQQIQGVEVAPVENNNLQWKVVLQGPAGTPYEGGKFRLIVTFPPEYPFKFPDFKFETQMFHPNIDEKGDICKEMVGEKDWVPTKKVSQVFAQLLSLFNDVNDTALNQQAYELYTNNKAGYEAKVKEFTQKYAK